MGEAGSAPWRPAAHVALQTRRLADEHCAPVISPSPRAASRVDTTSPILQMWTQRFREVSYTRRVQAVGLRQGREQRSWALPCTGRSLPPEQEGSASCMPRRGSPWAFS